MPTQHAIAMQLACASAAPPVNGVGVASGLLLAVPRIRSDSVLRSTAAVQAQVQAISSAPLPAVGILSGLLFALTRYSPLQILIVDHGVTLAGEVASAATSLLAIEHQLGIELATESDASASLTFGAAVEMQLDVSVAVDDVALIFALDITLSCSAEADAAGLLAVEHDLDLAAELATDATATLNSSVVLALAVDAEAASAGDLAVEHGLAADVALAWSADVAPLAIDHELAVELAAGSDAEAVLQATAAIALQAAGSFAAAEALLASTAVIAAQASTASSGTGVLAIEHQSTLVGQVASAAAGNLALPFDVAVALAVTSATADVVLDFLPVVVVAKPAGAAIGSTLVAAVALGGTAGVDAPGWTQVLLQQASGAALAVLRRVVSYSDSSYEFSPTDVQPIAVSLAAMGNVDPLAPVQVSGAQSNASGTAATAPSVSAGVAGMAVYAGAWPQNVRATPPSGMTEQGDLGAAGVGVYLATQAVNAGATGTRAATMAGAGASAAALVVMRPAQVVGTKSGTMPAGWTLPPAASALDFGTSGSGYHEINAVDGQWAANSPYAQTVLWTTHPTNRTVTTRTGKLQGLWPKGPGQADEFGLFAGTGTSDTDAYIRYSNVAMRSNNVPLRMFDNGTQVVGIEQIGGKWNFWIGTSPTDKRLSWNGSGLSVTGYISVGGAAGDVNNGGTFIEGGKIRTGSITANQIASNTITTSQINFSPVLTGSVIASINATAEGIRIAGAKIQIDGTVTFGSGYDPTTKIAGGGAAADVNANSTTINGGKITTGSITALQIAATTITADKLAAATITADKLAAATITADKIAGGTITGDKIAGGTISADKLSVTSLNSVSSSTGSLSVSGQLTVASAGAVVVGSNTVALKYDGLTMVQATGSTIDGSRLGFFTALDRTTRVGYIASQAGYALGSEWGSINALVLGAEAGGGRSGGRIFLRNGVSVSGDLGADADVSGNNLIARASLTVNTSAMIRGALQAGGMASVYGHEVEAPRIYARDALTAGNIFQLAAQSSPGGASGFLRLFFDSATSTLRAQLPGGTVKVISWS